MVFMCLEFKAVFRTFSAKETDQLRSRQDTQKHSDHFVSQQCGELSRTKSRAVSKEVVLKSVCKRFQIIKS